MLKLEKIDKDYKIALDSVKALKNVSLEFRKSEFVAILGQSGSGKTTLLNIIGGLDRYTAGDLIINGRSTKEYKDSDWDSYRNHSIGFVFQNYNLIPHLSVLRNVELALTLSGVSAEERHRRATEVLISVGLEDQINKKPNQMSGGQMQRVAIARALVNNPDIILADEPTGALDTATSVQVMEILKKVSQDRLVIMVTHNPDLAEKYASRTVRLLDGELVSDSNPYVNETVYERSVGKKKEKKDKTSMSFFTALSLSARNLLTKKGRTIMTSFAGSIGIIGIALVMAMSNGFQSYVDRVQRDTLSTYPLTIAETTVDLQAAMSIGTNNMERYSDVPSVVIDKVQENVQKMIVNNNLDSRFISYLEDETKIDSDLYYDIAYDYGTQLPIYGTDKANGNALVKMESEAFVGLSVDENSVGQILKVWQELIDIDFLSTQYDVLRGHMPENKNQVIICVDSYNRISDACLEALGLYDFEVDNTENSSISFDELMNLRFNVLSNNQLYQMNSEETFFIDKSDDLSYVQTVINDETTIPLEVVGIVRIKEGTSTGFITGTVGFHPDLMESFRADALESDIVEWLLNKKTYVNNPLTNVGAYVTVDPFIGEVGLPTTYMKALSEFDKYGVNSSPKTINIVPIDFEAKEAIKEAIKAYSAVKLDSEGNQVLDENNEPIYESIRYTDIMELVVSSMNAMISAISYVLIAFTSVSLIVSSIMIGIITYVSVIERTKEIGILRSIGARKKDISRVFNAETFIIGLCAGLFGVLVTIILTVPINIILFYLTEVENIASLHPVAAVSLIVISVILTLFAGVVPARFAAKKDPVVALRTE